MKFNWPLNNSNFTLLDKAKICLFFLNPNNFWTQGKYVKTIEAAFAKFVDAKYAVYVSSGSTANTLLAMNLKDSISRNKKIIIFPSTTWTTSISPFIREGFIPKFIDISLEDFCLDLDKTEDYLRNNHKKVAAIVCVSLIGQVPDLNRLKEIEKRYKVKIYLDNCENTLGKFSNKNISSYFTSTTSTYFGHQIQSVEGGFIFTSCKKEYEYFLLNRNHGLVRSLPPESINIYKNSKVDAQFDFYSLGNNFRNTDINAFIGLLDLNRADSYIKKRNQIYEKIKNKLRFYNLLFPQKFKDRTSVPFCFPMISKDKYLIKCLKDFCFQNKIEIRPIISGNLLRQTCYRKYDNYKKFKNSEFLHKNGFYIGIYPTLKDNNINKLDKFRT